MGVVVSLAEVRGPTKNFREIMRLAGEIRTFGYHVTIPKGKLLACNELLRQEIEIDSCRSNLTQWMEVLKILRPGLGFAGITRPHLVVRLALTSHLSAGIMLARFPYDAEAYHKFHRLCTVIASCRLH